MDEQSPTSVEETTESVEVENESTDEDVSLEDIEVSEEELGEEESKSDDEEESAGDESDEETEDETEEESDDESEDDESESEEEQRKAFNREQAERRLQAKAERQALIKQQQAEYISQAEDPTELALRQLQVDSYTNKVEFNSNKLVTQYEKAVKDFDILRNPDPVVQAELDAAIDAFQALNVEVDIYGNPVDVRADLYEYLQTKADSISKLTSIGAQQQIKDKSKEKSKTFKTPTRAPKEAKVDPDVEAFDEEASKW